MNKPKIMLTVDVEALPIRADTNHIDTLIYGYVNNNEYGIGRMMDIADKHNIKMTFFVDFAECEIYGDAIIEVGKYIMSRGHDIQVHCHYNFLERIVSEGNEKSFDKNYFSWYINDEYSQKMIDYVTEKYMECTKKAPLVYRGGAFRFGTSILKALKNNGYIADMTYNCVRPNILPENKQFKYENGLLELPIGVIPNKTPLNFNYNSLCPKTIEDFPHIVQEYKKLFNEYLDYYGEDAILTVLMHSWSFMYQFDRFSSTGYIDAPNHIMADFFDYFLDFFKDTVDFSSVSDALKSINYKNLKIADFRSIFHNESRFSEKNIRKIIDYIIENANGRRIIIWGKGWLEATIFQTVDFNKILDTTYYISNDADCNPIWRGKPVYKFSDITLNPKEDYVFILAQSTFYEIRDSLCKLGFKEYKDFFDIQKNIPLKINNDIKVETDVTCPICNGNIFETYNSNKLRRCSKCGSIERTRTALKFIKENINKDFSKLRLLHVSPSKSERMIFSNLNCIVDTVDIRPECKTDIIADICNMPEIASESYDIVFANCVLNHVYDDREALLEISRVLRKNGEFLVYAMGNGTLKSTVSDNPTSWYGQENYEKYKIGTFRHYGEVDLTNLLSEFFSHVRCFEKYDEITDDSCKWYRCIK